VFPVGNAAHASGLLLGVLLGLAVVRSHAWGWAAAGTIAAIAVAVTVGRPFVNLGRTGAAQGLAYGGRQLSEAGRPEAAARLYQEALRLDDLPNTWANLGYVQENLQRLPEARRSYRNACDGHVIGGCLNLALMLDGGAGGPADRPAARTLLRQACEAKEPYGCANLGRLYEAEGDPAMAITLYEQACAGHVQAACEQLAQLRSRPPSKQ
jgi:TPR repeat protein